MFFTIMAILQAGIAVLFTIIGLIWFKGKGIKMVSFWRVMSDKRKETIDQKAFLRFNACIILIAAGANASSAFFGLLGSSFGYLPGVLSIGILAVLSSYSTFAKRFRLKDDNGEPLDHHQDSKKQKKNLIFIGVLLAIITLPVVWLSLEGIRPIRAEFSPGWVNFSSGLYGIAVPFNEITEVYLYQMSMNDIGTGRRHMGHGTPNNLRGRFDAGHLLVQNPDEGPTIRISRRTAGPLYISLRTPQATDLLYYDITTRLN